MLGQMALSAAVMRVIAGEGDEKST